MSSGLRSGRVRSLENSLEANHADHSRSNSSTDRYRSILAQFSSRWDDIRRIGRERKTLIAERVFHVNRIKGLLFTQGIRGYEPVNRDRRQRLDALRTGDGRPLSKHLKAEICRELDRLELLLAQIKAVEAERDALIAHETPETPAGATALLGIRGIGPEFATILYTEGLFRHFDNRRQIASYAGLAPSPWQSGNVHREQGVSKAGNPRLRATMVELAWLWLRHQPKSALTIWFKERITRNSTGSQVAGCSVEVREFRCRNKAPERKRRHYRQHTHPQGLISPDGSRWTDRESFWLSNADLEVCPVLLSPCPSKTGW